MGEEGGREGMCAWAGMTWHSLVLGGWLTLVVSECGSLETPEGVCRV